MSPKLTTTNTGRGISIAAHISYRSQDPFDHVPCCFFLKLTIISDCD